MAPVVRLFHRLDRSRKIAASEISFAAKSTQAGLRGFEVLSQFRMRIFPLQFQGEDTGLGLLT